MVMEATKEIVSKEPLAGSILPDQFDRQPLDDAQLLAVDNLNVMGPRDVIGKDKLYQLANKVGLLEVVRWKPRLVCSCPPTLSDDVCRCFCKGSVRRLI